MFSDFNIGPVTLHMYGLMIAVGFISALFVTSARAKKRGMSDDIVTGIFYCAIVGGLVGTRLLFYIVEIPSIIKDPSILWNFKNGYVVYGGIIGGVLVSYIFIRKKKEDFLAYFDLVMPAVAMAQGFGRLGCFFAGCCYGRQTEAWYGITFKTSQFAPNGVKLIPTQLISSAGDFIIAAVLMLYAKKNPKKGRVAAGYMLLYGIGRFLVEYLRNDYRGNLGIFSTSQFISMGIVLLGILFGFFTGKLKATESVDADKDADKEEAKEEKED